MDRWLLPLLFALGCICGAAGITGSDSDLKQMLSTEMLDFTVNTARLLHNKSTLVDNIVFSPINVYAALSLSHLAVADTTREELADVLDWPKQDHQAINIHKNLGNILNSMLENKSEPLTLVKIANGMFVDINSKIKPNFLKNLKKYYRSGDVLNLDFSRSPLKATQTINEWISGATTGVIRQLFLDPLPSSTRLILANTLYFCGRWVNPFPPENTKRAAFSNYGQPLEVDMMNHVEYLHYINDSSLLFEAISKPYEGGDYSMIFVNLYDTQDHRNLSDYITSDVMKQTVLGMQPKLVDYSIPRVKFIYMKGLKTALQDQGLTEVFEGTQFSNLLEGSSSPMKLTDVFHASSVDINEEGTHANEIIKSEGNSQSNVGTQDERINFYVRTPFIVCLLHVKTSTCLFYGFIHKPEDSKINYLKVS